jgi:hypothetical protein
MTVGRMQIALGEHVASTVGRVTLVTQDSSSLGSAAQRLTLSRYVARLKPPCGSLALSVVSDVVAYVLKALRCRRWALPYG